MDEIIKELIKHNDTITVAIILIIISGVIYIFKQVIQALISKDLEVFKNENSKEIEKLKSELDKQKQQLEHMHQVSQPTYQSLFQKKINIYQDIIKITSPYKLKQEEFKEMNNLLILDSIQEFDSLEEYIKTLNKIENIFEKNKLFFSNELVKKYEILIKEFKSFNVKLYEIHTEYQGANSINEQYNYQDDIKLIYEKIYEKTQLKLMDFHNVLNTDIQKIKNKINLD